MRHLTLKWSISRARYTYGYNVRTLIDDETGKRYRCLGGGYDLTGTAFGEWLEDVYRPELLAIADNASACYARSTETGNMERTTRTDGLYGMTYHADDKRVTLDGACGMESMVRIAKAIGLDVKRVYDRRGSESAIVVAEAVTED